MLNLFFKSKRQDFDIISENLFKDYLENHTNRKLQIGCGKKNILDGWLNTDIVCKNKNIGYLDAGKIFPFEDNTFQYIFSEHIFEHLNFKQAVNMLSECFRTLKAGGTLRLSTPNLDFLINLYQNPNLPLHKEYITWATKMHIKDVAKKTGENDPSAVYVVNNFFKDWGHQIIHNFESVNHLLTDAGFIQIVRCEINESNDAELHNIEMHGNTIPFEFNKLETMVIEAKKAT